MAEKQSQLIETLSAVRSDPTKRSVPLDNATFFVKADRFAEAKFDDQFIHVDLIGDALVTAERIAKDVAANSTSPSSQFRATNERLKVLFSPDKLSIQKDQELERDLQPVVDEKLLLVGGTAKIFNLKLKAVSAIDFLREQQAIAARVIRILTTVFCDDEMDRKESITKLQAFMRGETLDPSKMEVYLKRGDLVRSGLSRSKFGVGDIGRQLCAGYYGAVEGGIHAGIIEQGGTVITYKGSERITQKDIAQISIIEAMRRLIVWALHTLQEDELALKVAGESLIMDEKLDGKGLFNAPSGGLNAQSTNPFTLDFDGEKIIEPQKLPLLLFQDGRLRPVTSDEVNSVAVDNESGGLVGQRGHLWRHNLSTVARFFDVDRARMDLITQNTGIGVSRDAMDEWVNMVVKNGFDTTAKKKMSLVPTGRAHIAGHLVAAIAGELVREMERIKKGRKGGGSEGGGGGTQLAIPEVIAHETGSGREDADARRVVAVG